MAAAARAFRPIRCHPLFPAIVALWFAALFGLCGLTIHSALLETLIDATGLDRVIPAAVPPAGLAARAVIALALAVAGGLIGALLGRAAASPRRTKGEIATRRRDAHPDAPSRRPVSAHAELGESPLPDMALTPTEDIAMPGPGSLEGPEEEFSPASFDFASLELVHLPQPECAPAFAADPAAAPEPVAAGSTPEPAPTAPPLGKAAQRILSAELDTLTPLELVERLGISMQRRRAGTVTAPAAATFASPPMPLRRVHSAPRASADNERLLRSALATLEKISGAA